MEKIILNEKILSKNDLIAQELRNFYKKHSIYVVNILSSPGSGKTSLLEKILPQLKEFYNILVLVGDLQTNNECHAYCKNWCKCVTNKYWSGMPS